MKTYYIHGKITPGAFHLTATLLEKPPRGYYFISKQIADSKHQAIRMKVETCLLHPRNGKEISLAVSEVQRSFIQEN